MKITIEQHAALLGKGVHLFGDSTRINFAFSRENQISVEPPVQLRPGTYDINHLGAFSYLGGVGSSFRHIESIGRFCSIAGNIVTGQVEHSTDWLSAHPLLTGRWGNEMDMLSQWYDGNERIKLQEQAYNATQRAKFRRITIGNDCWIGEGVFIRRGVAIGDGAIIASRSVVTHDVAPYAIVAGVPAKTIRMRFEERIVQKLLEMRWWDYGLSILRDVDATDIEKAIDKMAENIHLGIAQRYSPARLLMGNEGLVNCDPM